MKRRPYSLLSFILYLLSFTFLLSCAGKGSNATVANDSHTNDSQTLRIAVLPIEECEPLRHAQQSGLARRMGLNMTLLEYDAMMDIDTAVLSNVAHVYFEDSRRMKAIKVDSLRPTMALPIPVRMALIANKDKGIDTLTSLKSHMVGVTRISALETWMTAMADSANMGQDDVFHAQVNSIAVRFRMLDGGLIDAAIMPYPWADSLQTLGHTAIQDTILEGMGFFLDARAKEDTIRQRQVELLKKVYLEAMKNEQ